MRESIFFQCSAFSFPPGDCPWVWLCEPFYSSFFGWFSKFPTVSMQPKYYNQNITTKKYFKGLGHRDVWNFFIRLRKHLLVWKACMCFCLTLKLSTPLWTELCPPQKMLSPNPSQDLRNDGLQCVHLQVRLVAMRSPWSAMGVQSHRTGVPMGHREETPREQALQQWGQR